MAIGPTLFLIQYLLTHLDAFIVYAMVLPLLLVAAVGARSAAARKPPASNP